jgi:hypothetical protein|tara:strand:- start:7886 stop:8188 length:303 start_codon:yes stop_codon:yes gene_type:complete
LILTPEEEEKLEREFDLLWSHPDREKEDLFDIKNDGLPIYTIDWRKDLLYFNSKQDFRNWLINNAGNEEMVGENMSQYTQLKTLNNFIINYNQQLPQVIQ